MRAPTPSNLAAAKLISSGLTEADAKDLGIEILSAKQTAELFPKSAGGQPVQVPALKLNYFDLAGKAIKGMFRARVLEAVRGAFGAIHEKMRYLQPANTPPRAYLPKTTSWKDIAVDPTYDLLITEGELKAACAAKHGYACIGLGGVWSWRSAGLNWGLLPELEAFEWAKRQVYIIYDSDAATNPQVAIATSSLVATLSKRGALPRVVVLPGADGKVGLDDFIVRHGKDPLDRLIAGAEGDDLSQKLWEMNGTFAFINDPPLIVNETDPQKVQKHRPDAFKGSIFANRWATKVHTRVDGSKGLKQVNVAKEWIEWPHRRTYTALTFAPGKERVHNGMLNEWTGWAVAPCKGTVKPWTELLDRLFDGAEELARVWFERWCLYPIAFPGTKMLTAAAIWSLHQGIGKSLVGKTLSKIYGGNYYSEITQRDLEGSFNFWAPNKQFVMVDDVSAYDNKLKADILKSFISQDHVNVNTKGLPQYVLPNVANLYMTSNRANAFYIEDRDRRLFIHEVTNARVDLKFMDLYHDWLKSIGPAALLSYAQQEMDFGDFQHFAPAPLTAAKMEMVSTVRNEVETWLTALRDDPDHYLKMGQVSFKRDLFTASELLAFFEPTRKGAAVTAVSMGMHAKHFFPRAPGSPLKPNGHTERFYVVRNAERWQRQARLEAEDHVRQHREQESSKQQGGKF